MGIKTRLTGIGGGMGWCFVRRRHISAEALLAPLVIFLFRMVAPAVFKVMVIVWQRQVRDNAVGGILYFF